MKKRICKKRMKKEATKIIKELNPTLQLLIRKSHVLPSAGGYWMSQKAICLNFEKLKELHATINKEISITIQDLMKIAIVHEFGHSTNQEQEKAIKLYNQLSTDIKKETPLKRWEKSLQWHEYLLKEEIRAWRMAKEVLSEIPINKINTIISFCVNGYQVKVESIKREIEKVKFEIKTAS